MSAVIQNVVLDDLKSKMWFWMIAEREGPIAVKTRRSALVGSL